MAGYKTLNFHGVDVRFPYDPYPAQEAYIEKCVESLVKRNHAVLESPTGTGKTLCLLASVIAFRVWAKKNPHKLKVPGISDPKRSKVPSVIYASRTHSQLTQVVSELRKLRDVCGYRIDMTVVGGRSSLCVNDEVKRIKTNSEQQNECRRLRKNGGCPHKREADKVLGIIGRDHQGPINLPLLGNDETRSEEHMKKFLKEKENRQNERQIKEELGEIMDIEELVSWCSERPIAAGQKEEKKVCSYYLSRGKADSVEILLMPYNYILDTKIRRRNSFEIGNKIIILDEAHNVEQVCEESSSHYLTLKMMQIAHDELAKARDKVARNNEAGAERFTHAELDDLTREIDGLNNRYQMEIVDDVQNAGKDGKAYPVAKFIQDLRQAGMFKFGVARWLGLAEQVVKFFSDGQDRTGLSGTSFEEFAFMIEDMTRLAKNREEYENYRIQMVPEENDSQDMEIKIWCFNASYAIDYLTKGEAAYNLILTSGTLSPLDEYINSLGLDQKHQLKTIQLMNTHVIDPAQLFVATLTGTEGAEFLNVFRNRTDRNMFHKFAEIIKELKKVSPGGMLIFHPTYSLMKISKDFWGLDKRNATYKNDFGVPVFLEPSGKYELERMTENFERELEEDEKKGPDEVKGAIFNGVCRGKMSEGVDFADCRGRVVIITGIPYAPAKDPKVVLKKEYLNNRKQAGRGITDGNKWYGIEAIRAINQAVGRIIRHKNDFGAIIYMDTRFQNRGNNDAFNLMPEWVKRNHRVLSSKQAIGQLRAFFKKMEAFQKLGKITRPRPLSEARAAQQNSRNVSRKESTLQKNRRHVKVGKEESKENILPQKMAPLFNKPNARVNQPFKDPSTKKRPLERDSSTVNQRRSNLEEPKIASTPEPKRRSWEMTRSAESMKMDQRTGPAGFVNRNIPNLEAPHSSTGSVSPYFPKPQKSQDSDPTLSQHMLSDDFSLEWQVSSDEDEATEKARPSTSGTSQMKVTPKESKDEFEFEFGDSIPLDISIDESIAQAEVEEF